MSDPLHTLVLESEEIVKLPAYEWEPQRKPRQHCMSCDEPVFFNSKCYEHFERYWKSRIAEIIRLKQELKKSQYREEQYKLKYLSRNKALLQKGNQ